MIQEQFYEVGIRWDRGRIGTMHSTELDRTIEVATPPGFAGGVAGVWSPEHLLVAAVESCLMTTFLAIAENSKLSFESFESSAVGKLEVVDGKYMVSEITLSPVVEIANEADLARAERVLAKSDAACLISNSVKSKIVFQPKVVVVSAVA